MDLNNEYIAQNYLNMTDREMAEKIGLSTKAVKNRRQRMQLFKDTGNYNYDTDDTKKLLDEVGVALEEVGKVEKLTVTKRRVETQKGENPPDVNDTTTTAVTISPRFNEPEWPVVQQCKPTIIKPVKAKKLARSMKVAILGPDPQIGFRLDPKTKELDPFHDRRAMNIFLQVIKEFEPDKIINLGDLLDFPQFGRYAQEPGFALTTQDTLEEGHRFLAEQRANAPDAEIVVLEGNHDLRLASYIMQNAKAAFGITRAKDPSGWPVMSVPYLLRMDELNINYVAGYPAGEYYINDRLKCIHGRRTGQRGKVAARVLEDERISTVTGHNHHIELLHKTLHSRNGPVSSYAASLGCLCRIDGVVPSYGNGINEHGNAVKKYEDWQQGIGIIYYEEGEGDHTLVHVPIHEGKAIIDGKVYQAED
jgi:hypothetical protein